MMRPIAPIAVLGAVLLAAGCASRSPAPVDDRRPAPIAQPRLPVLQPVPAAGVTPTAAGTYIVKRGDTLYSIARGARAAPTCAAARASGAAIRSSWPTRILDGSSSLFNCASSR